jgi:hypothetical protein
MPPLSRGRRLGDHEVLYESRGILLVRITEPLREP